MLLIGLTGGIATGKSTVSNLLRSPSYNLPIIDADVLARKVVEPGTPGYAAIVHHFGPSTPDLLLSASDPLSGGHENGKDSKGRPLNRPALGRRVFGEGTEKDRKVLNGIVHPAVRREMYKAMLWAYLSGHWACVLDIPLLFESGWEPLCGTIMVVAVHDPVVQLRRLRERDPHLSAQDAENRVRAQMSVEEKVKRCESRGEGMGVVVWNDDGKEDLEREVGRVMEVIRSRRPGWWAWFLLLCPPAAMGAGLWSFAWSWVAKRRWEAEWAREKAKL